MKFIFNTQFSIFNSRNPLWEKYYSWTPYQYCRNNPITSIDPSGYADYIDKNGKKIGSDGNSSNSNMYLVDSEGFQEAQQNGNWEAIQGNRIPNSKSSEKILKTYNEQMSPIQEFGLVEAKNGMSTEVVSGPVGKACEPNSIDLTPQVNETILHYNSSPDILIHFHLKSSPGCDANLAISDGDKRTFNNLNQNLKEINLPQTSNAIMINANGFLQFYNGEKKTGYMHISVLKELYNK